MPQEKYVRLAEFNNPMPAHSMRILLEANGIDAQVHGDFSAEIAGIDCVSVVVRESEWAIAQRIITEVPAAAEVLVPEWTCDCGATVDEGFQVCWSCGQACPDDE